MRGSLRTGRSRCAPPLPAHLVLILADSTFTHHHRPHLRGLQLLQLIRLLWHCLLLALAQAQPPARPAPQGKGSRRFSNGNRFTGAPSRALSLARTHACAHAWRGGKQVKGTPRTLRYLLEQQPPRWLHPAGTFVMGEMHGEGTLAFRNHDRYEGSMDHNRMHGAARACVCVWVCVRAHGSIRPGSHQAVVPCVWQPGWGVPNGLAPSYVVVACAWGVVVLVGL